MQSQFQELMRQATLLTRSGKLAEAAAAIQAALRGSASHGQDTDESNVIDVEAWEVHPSRTPEELVEPAAARAYAPSRSPRQGDEFISGSFRSGAGQRDYKLYVPPMAGDECLPLIVMLHGCTQDANDFAAGTAMNAAARAQGFFVLYPVQSSKANPQKCWNWFKHNHQRVGGGEPSILSDMTRDVMRTHRIDPQRVYVAGLSAGGAMAAILANLYPDLYAAAGVHSGLAAGTATDLPTALAAMRNARPVAAARAGNGVRTIVFHGDRDSTVHPGNAQAVAVASAGSAATVQTASVAGRGNGLSSTVYTYRNAAGDVVAERWEVHGAAHAWVGGSPAGSYTEPAGPDATAEMLRFFFERA